MKNKIIIAPAVSLLATAWILWPTFFSDFSKTRELPLFSIEMRNVEYEFNKSRQRIAQTHNQYNVVSGYWVDITDTGVELVFDSYFSVIFFKNKNGKLESILVATHTISREHTAHEIQEFITSVKIAIDMAMPNISELATNDLLSQLHTNKGIGKESTKLHRYYGTGNTISNTIYYKNIKFYLISNLEHFSKSFTISIK